MDVIGNIFKSMGKTHEKSKFEAKCVAVDELLSEIRKKPKKLSKASKKPYTKKCDLCGKLFDERLKYVSHKHNHKRNKKLNRHPFKKPDKIVETNEIIHENKVPVSANFYDEIASTSAQSKHLRSNISNKIASYDDVLTSAKESIIKDVMSIKKEKFEYEIACPSSQSNQIALDNSVMACAKEIIIKDVMSIKKEKFEYEIACPSSQSNQIALDNSVMACTKESIIKDVMSIKNEKFEFEIACPSSQSSQIASDNNVMACAKESIIKDIMCIKKENFGYEIACTSAESKDISDNSNVAFCNGVIAGAKESIIKDMPVKKDNFKCKICDRVFTKKKTYRNHVYNHNYNKKTAKHLFFHRKNEKF